MTKEAKALHEVVSLCAKLLSVEEWIAERCSAEGKSPHCETLQEVREALPTLIVDLIKPSKSRRK